VHEWREHTGELELHVVAPTQREIFAEATAAIAGVLGDGLHGELVERRIDVAAPDEAALLAEWLGELVWLAERECLVPHRVADLALDGTTAHGTVELRPGRPRDLVKAVTYHGLACRPQRDGWCASVVFDV
jgi:SHS2 domain-containing protein